MTGIWKRLDLDGVEEVLLTPKGITLPKEPKTILIDNGCWRVNVRGISPQILEDHIAICEILVEDPRCVFILPDVDRDKDVSNYYLDRFLSVVRPRRYSLIDLEFFLDRKDLIYGSEFLSIPSKRAQMGGVHFDIAQYHQLGASPIEGGRSWDDLTYDYRKPLREAIAGYTK